MWKLILKTTLIAGSLDITAASIQTYILKGLTPDIVLKFIASGIFGKTAYSGGIEYMLFGLLVHFFIVFMCVITYFYFYPKFPLLNKNILLSSFLVALTAWIVTTKIIIPLSEIQPSPFNLKKDVIAIAILFFCIGIPIALITKRFYSNSLK
ncbi:MULTISPECIES: DUF1440 domain-containing protein [Flavobacterium]|uniref:DUF1440 domain-containing protein n=1 Tax=Flavobacterium hankyongi TaxID=1176532 RepID=A0ABP8ZJZ4_9FLAO|nr:DUF1440 domain-containing protein [Flavobacterium sp. N1846]